MAAILLEPRAGAANPPHVSSRRAVLGALAATAALAGAAVTSTPAEAATGTTLPHRWNAAVAAWERANDACDRHFATVWKPAAAAVEGIAPADRSASEAERLDAIADENDRLCNLRTLAEERVMLLPAPHLAALFWKMDHMFGEAADRGPADPCDSFCPEWTNALMADAQRLLL